MLCVCTANMCRSPMLEAFLGSALRARGVDAHVHSAGTLADGRGAVHEVVEVSHARGHDLTPHRSRRLDRDLVEGADLVLPLAREHLREVVVTSPEAFLGRLHEGRTTQELLRDDPDDDVADPIGGPYAGYERTAAELEQLALTIAALLAPSGAGPGAPPTPAFQET